MGQRPIIGETYQPNAAEMRRFHRVADEFDKQLLSVGGRPVKTQLGPGVCLIKNGTNAAVGRFEILGISDTPWMTPTDSEDRFCAFLPLVGILPEFPGHDGKFVILMEPAAENQVVWAVNSGIAVVKVEITSGLEWYGCADVTHGDKTKLTLLPSGAAQVLYKESGTGTKWAIVRLGVPSLKVSKRIVLDAALNTSGNAAASVWAGTTLADTGNNITVVDGDANWHMMDTNGSFASGTHAIAGWYPDSRTWQLENAACANT